MTKGQELIIEYREAQDFTIKLASSATVGMAPDGGYEITFCLDRNKVVSETFEPTGEPNQFRGRPGGLKTVPEKLIVSSVRMNRDQLIALKTAIETTLGN